MKMKTFNCLLLCFLVSLLWACGGGGSGGSEPVMHSGNVFLPSYEDVESIEVCYAVNVNCVEADIEDNGAFEIEVPDNPGNLEAKIVLKPLIIPASLRAISNPDLVLKAANDSAIVSPATTINLHNAETGAGGNEIAAVDNAQINESIFNAMKDSVNAAKEEGQEITSNVILVIYDKIAVVIVVVDGELTPEALADLTEVATDIVDIIDNGTIEEEVENIETRVIHPFFPPTASWGSFTQPVSDNTTDSFRLARIYPSITQEQADAYAAALEASGFERSYNGIWVNNSAGNKAGVWGYDGIEQIFWAYEDVSTEQALGSADWFDTYDPESVFPTPIAPLAEFIKTTDTLVYIYASDGYNYYVNAVISAGFMLQDGVYTKEVGNKIYALTWDNSLSSVGIYACIWMVMEGEGGGEPEPEPSVCNGVIPAGFPEVGDWGDCNLSTVATEEDSERIIRTYRNGDEADYTAYGATLEAVGYELTTSGVWTKYTGNETYAFGYSEYEDYQGTHYNVFWAHEAVAETVSPEASYAAWMTERRNGESGLDMMVTAPLDGFTAIQTDETLAVYYLDEDPDTYISAIGSKPHPYLPDTENGLWYSEVYDDNFLGNKRFEWTYDNRLSEFGIVGYIWRVTDIVAEEPSIPAGFPEVPEDIPFTAQANTTNDNYEMVSRVYNRVDLAQEDIDFYTSELTSGGFMPLPGNDPTFFTMYAKNDGLTGYLWAYEPSMPSGSVFTANTAVWVKVMDDAADGYVADNSADWFATYDTDNVFPTIPADGVLMQQLTGKVRYAYPDTRVNNYEDTLYTGAEFEVSGYVDGAETGYHKDVNGKRYSVKIDREAAYDITIIIYSWEISDL